MEVWVKVGELDATKIVVVHAAPLIDDVKKAIKLTLKNRFSTVDKNEIIIRGSTAGNAISSTMPLNDWNSFQIDMGLDSKIPCGGASTINGFLADPSIVTAASFKGMVEEIAFPAVEPLMMISFLSDRKAHV